jgi:hypothetical protein
MAIAASNAMYGVVEGLDAVGVGNILRLPGFGAELRKVVVVCEEVV